MIETEKSPPRSLSSCCTFGFHAQASQGKAQHVWRCGAGLLGLYAGPVAVIEYESLREHALNLRRVQYRHTAPRVQASILVLCGSTSLLLAIMVLSRCFSLIMGNYVDQLLAELTSRYVQQDSPPVPAGTVLNDSTVQHCATPSSGWPKIHHT